MARGTRSHVAGRLGAFALVLLGTFGTAYAVGEKLPGHSHGAAGHTHTHPSGGMSTPVPAGFESNGFQLVTDHVKPGIASFHLRGPDGKTVTKFDKVHEAYLHVIIVRPDLSDYHHDHPEVRADGSWDVTLPGTGQWHVVFDSTPSGQSNPIIVSANMDDEQPVDTVPLPAPNDVVEVDGLTVTRTDFTFAVTNADGSVPTDLEPYLGQAAHLVAIRQGDLAYTHLHPINDMVGMFMFGKGITASGTYRLFLQFGHDGQVLLTEFTVVVP